MPMYEYVCAQCGKTTEALRRMADADAPIACEHCGNRKTRRAHSVFSAAVAESGNSSLPMSPCGQCGQQGGSCPFK